MNNLNWLVFVEIKMFTCINKKKEGKKMTEEQLKEVLIGIYETEYKNEQTFEEYADGWDFWIDKDGYILIEGRGMKPIDGIQKVGHVDNGVIYAY